MRDEVARVMPAGRPKERREENCNGAFTPRLFIFFFFFGVVKVAVVGAGLVMNDCGEFIIGLN